MRNAHTILVGRPEGGGPSEDLGMGVRIMLKWISEKSGLGVCIGFIWLITGTGGRLL
jgi:hypothetical protein